jgi:hypothetical protein
VIAMSDFKQRQKDKDLVKTTIVIKKEQLAWLKANRINFSELFRNAVEKLKMSQ